MDLKCNHQRLSGPLQCSRVTFDPMQSELAHRAHQAMLKSQLSRMPTELLLWLRSTVMEIARQFLWEEFQRQECLPTTWTILSLPQRPSQQRTTLGQLAA